MAVQALDDVIDYGLRVLFCGINPSVRSGATGHHFAHPANRFWSTLHRSGFTPRKLQPSEQFALLDYGLGVTNLVDRVTVRANELTKEELKQGGERLTAKVARYRPRWLAMVGLTAYRAAFGRPSAVVGAQAEKVSGVPVWLLPNPSGLNAHWTPAGLAEEYARLRVAAS
ncbi:TDG/mug DNA glycosylase family protein [Saccharomonospora amisosensis]|uniref:TDG/mug DNA glycosylase family protein n=1 Tax=Saccharomonospora amisosensis TaxID=1128677 RepID=A0A7X5UW92_9PSEU|nr:G/U mismatch-specific DNA glycosylase [Saccharomonospora amisosensis]NIJ15007.1 TDG/mug DNA glycosylase family protein [Saccharomonospora amisosensis]